jgi:hypothetical protein
MTTTATTATTATALDGKTAAGSWLGEDVLSIEQFGVQSAK